MNSKDKDHILYVDDERPNLDGIRFALRKEYQIHVAESAEDGINILDSGLPVKVVIADHRMPKITGVEFLEQVEKKYPEIIRILLTGYGDLDTIIQAVNKAKIYHFMSKPWKIDELRLVLTNAIEVFNLRQSNSKLIDDLQQSNTELIFARDKAQESDRLKTAFLSNLSHEIRTPLNSILGFTHLMKNTQLSEERRNEYAAIIESNSDELLHQIEDLLVLSNLDAGGLKINLVEVEVHRLMYETFLTFQNSEILHQRPGLNFVYRSPDNQDDKIISDPARIRQILGNLIDNAFKFTDNGNVEIGYSFIEESERHCIQFYVKDSGIGIPSENVHVIFEKFVKNSDTNDRLYRGSGLGLTISKRLAELLQGKITLDSEAGKGSAFYLTIPLEMA
jgi:two-component system, sensor histidine kinase and response regulator